MNWRPLLVSVLACLVSPPVGLAAEGPRGTVRVAGIVLKWVRTEKSRNYGRVEPMIREAARQGARIVCTTECFLDGYAIADKSIPLDAYRALGEAVPGGEYFRKLAQLADELNIYLVAGMLEADGQARYNTAVLIGPDGKLIGKYRKQKLGHETVRNTPGTESLVFPTPYGRMGVMICADRRYPDVVGRFFKNGADFLVCPSGGMFGPKTNDPILQARSRENRSHIVFVHPAEFLVTGPKGGILSGTILGKRLLIDPRQVGGEQDVNRVFYYDLPLPGRLPADCALAKNERPRLLLRGRDLERYRRRIAGPMKGDFERFRAFWDKRIAQKGYDWKSAEQMDGVCLGVLYQLTGQRRYADVVRASTAFRKGSRSWSHAFALDLIFDALSKEEVRAQAEGFLKDAAGKYRWGSRSSCLWPAAALHGAATPRNAEIEKWLHQGAAWALEDIAHLNEWAADRGGDVNSFSYVGNHTMIRLGAHLHALTNAFGRDVWEECTWARHIGSYYVYHFLPWRTGAIHFDNTTGLCVGPNHGDFGGTYLLHAAPGRYRDGLYQWWIQRMLVHEAPHLRGWPKTARHNHVMAGLWGRILFHDPRVPELDPRHFPPSRLFRTRGFAAMRESWAPDATFVHFRCGAWGDLGDGRHNADNNTFSVYKKGILALDTGAQHSLDSHALKFTGGSKNHNRRYASETIAHNGILVRHAIDDPFWKQYGKVNAGGQVLRRWPPEWSRLRHVPPREPVRRGRILAWETSPDYDYVCGDATKSHSPTTVDAFTRQLVYVRGDMVFLFDRVEAARDGCRTTWLLHTADRPTIDGKETPDSRIHGEGHFLWDGSVVTITDAEMGGRMFCKTLLPAKRQVRLVGGAGHEFELPDGANPGPTGETYKLPKDHRAIRESRAEGEGLRGWRIEVEDRGPKRSVRFLHVFQTCRASTPKMTPCELVERDGMVGTRVRGTGWTVEVLFRDKGRLGGHITIRRAGRPAVARPLATTIDDNYRRWKDHGDYAKWTTDPCRRSVVLGTTPRPR